jgi:putative transposase
MGRPTAVLELGDWVAYDGEEFQVAALAGTSVRLRSANGADRVVLAAFLMGAPDFEILRAGERVLPAVEPFGVLDGLGPEVLAAAKELERHLIELETGLPHDSPEGALPRPQFDPRVRGIGQRIEAKAAELGLAERTLRKKRSNYAAQGLWGLVDGRLVREWYSTGRVDARVVAVARQIVNDQEHASTGTRSRLIRAVTKEVETVYGKGVVPLPGKTTFYKLLNTLASGKHTFGSAATRRQEANRPAGQFTPTFAARPGEQVQIDSTPIDVMVMLDTGETVRADLTIAVDIATRTICAAALRPVGTKAVDAALLLARMLVPEPMRPGWAETLRMSASLLPHDRLAAVDERMRAAAARPVIVPETIVIDGGKVFLSETFTRACAKLGISIQRARPRTPTDKAIVERTFGSINDLFCQYVAGYTGPNVTRRGDRIDNGRLWTVPELQDLFEEWALTWQERPHDGLRDPYRPKRPMSPTKSTPRWSRSAATCRCCCPARTTWSCCRSHAARSTNGAFASTTAPTTPPTSTPGGGSTRATAHRKAAGRSTTTPTTSRASSCAPRTAGSPSPGSTCRSSPPRSRSSPGSTPAASLPRSARTPRTRPPSPGS